MNPDIDITDRVAYEADSIDAELMPLTRCVCGTEFDYWQFPIPSDRERAQECPGCHRKIYFGLTVRVYEVIA